MISYKSIAIMTALVVASASAGAVEIEVTDAVGLKMPGDACHPVLSPDGALLLYSSVDHTGLNAYDMSTGAVSLLDESAAAGFAPVFSTDSRRVFYRTAVSVDGLINRDVRCVDILTGRSTRLEGPSRKSKALQSIDRTTYAVADYDHINVAVDGVVKELSPVDGAHSYLWASISPDGTRLLFNEPFKGVFVSDLDGSNARCLSLKGDFPSWVDNDDVAFVVTSDDGYVVTESKIVVLDLTTGGEVSVTPDEVTVSELTASPVTGDVVYSTVEGEMYRMNVIVNRQMPDKK